MALGFDRGGILCLRRFFMVLGIQLAFEKPYVFLMLVSPGCLEPNTFSNFNRSLEL